MTENALPVETLATHDISDNDSSESSIEGAEGYAADGEEIDTDSDDTAASSSSSLSRKSFFFPTVHRRKRKRPASLVQCPIHPDIDTSLTALISSSAYQSQESRGPTMATTAPSYLTQLPRLLAEFNEQFYDLNSKSVEKKDFENTREDMEMGRAAKRVKSATPIMYGRFVKLEDALSFTPCPRLLMEAEPPYRVVHANAAYAYLQGTRMKRRGTSYTDLVSTIQSLFGHDLETSLTVYPVTEDRRGSTLHSTTMPRLTHYLVEASDKSLSQSTTRTSMTSSRNTLHHAQAIG